MMSRRIRFAALVWLSISLLSASLPPAGVAGDLVLVQPFADRSDDRTLSWLPSALVSHLRHYLARYDAEVTILEGADATADLESPGDKEVQDWLAQRGARAVISGTVQASSGSIRLSGQLVEAGGVRLPFNFNSKASELPQFIHQPGYLALEALRRTPVKKPWPVEPAPPLTLSNRLEINFGKPVSLSEFLQSETFYLSAVKIDPNNADAYYQLGILYWQANQGGRAMEHLETAVRKNPKYTKYHTGLGLAYYLSGRTDEAMAEFIQSTLLDDRFAEGHYFLSSLYRETGDLEKAESSLDRARASDPGYRLLEFGEAMIRYDHGDLDAAAGLFEAALAKTPRFSEAYNNLGVILLEQGEVEQAEKQFQKALAADDRNTAAMNNLGVIRCRQKAFAEAISDFQRAADGPAPFPMFEYNLGCASLRLGDLRRATEHYTQALYHDPLNTDALNNLALVYFLEGDLSAAENALKKATEVDLGAALAHYNRGVVHQELGQKRLAVADYLMANKATHRLFQMHINLGLLYEELEQEPKALTEYLKSLSLTSDIPEVYLYLGMIYLRLGYPELAFETIKKSTLVSFSDPTAYYLLGQLFQDSDRTRAAEYYQLFLKNIQRDQNRGPIWQEIVERKLNELGY